MINPDPFALCMTMDALQRCCNMVYEGPMVCGVLIQVCKNRKKDMHIPTDRYLGRDAVATMWSRSWARDIF